MTKKKRTVSSSLRNAALFFLGASLFAVIFYLSDLSLTELLQHLREISTGYYVALFIMYALILFVVSHRWALIVKSILPDRLYKRGFFFYSLTLGHVASLLPMNKAGDMGAKIICLKIATKASIKDGLYSTLTEILLSLYVYVVMGVIALAFVLEYIPRSQILIVGLGIVSLCFYLLIRYYDVIFKGVLTVIKAMSKITPYVPFMKSKAPPEMASIPPFTIGKPVMSRLLGYTLLFYFMTLIKCYLLAVALRIDLDVISFLVTYPIILIISAIGITPSGLGITELGWIGLLTYLGIDYEQAALYALIKRMVDYSALLLIGLWAYLSYTFYFNKRPHYRLHEIENTDF